MGKLLLQSLFGECKIESPALLAAIGDMNFLYFSGVLFLISVVVIVLASLSGRAPDRDTIKGLTFSSLDRKTVRASWDAKDIAATTVVLGLVATLYIYFSFWVG
jgi:SSS family solute:Na+ symporter